MAAFNSGANASSPSIVLLDYKKLLPIKPSPRLTTTQSLHHPPPSISKNQKSLRIPSFLLSELVNKQACFAGDSELQQLLHIFRLLRFFTGVGADVDTKSIELLLKEVTGKDITELIASGREKLASVPSGGGVALRLLLHPAVVVLPLLLQLQRRKNPRRERKKSDDDMRLSLSE
ncbi:unnamed protein product [Microthlaspi erraticum]|uniref:Uncharacterized protein n=1 Tax=Microthlaspi erraticum TaxID=1685480 RepID=A0A6D2I4S6_9BRAS|nr:unnamed protein product [Microthlaspi erraticum]CAA7054881.1 unnamed protein product [Microthlaspi erraticum]